MLCKLGFLALIAASVVSVGLSANIVVVRRLDPDPTRPPLPDLFSNRQCPLSTCPSERSTCVGGRCCMCQCLYDYPNVFMNRIIGSLRCTNYAEINSLSSANCQYSFRKPNEPLEVIAITEVATGKIRFKNDSARVDCNENGLTVDQWQYLDVDGRLKNGEGNVFEVDFRTVGGRNGSKKDLTFLRWNAMLDAKYAGLIIKLPLSCTGRNVGCLLAKINGTYTYNTLQSTTSAPPSTTASQQPSTAPPPTTVTLSTPATSPTPDTSPTPVPEETALPLTEASETPAPENASRPPPNMAVRTYFSSTEKTSTRSAGQQQQQQPQGSEERVTSTNVATPTLIGIVGLICLIGLVCLIVVLYKRRKRRSTEQPAKDPENDSEAKLDDHQDPVYAELPENTQNAGDFDNPIYCDPTEDQIFVRRSKLDPLPALPGNETTYQPLDLNTRAAPAAPTPPPASTDYLNPDREEPDTVDYDNPPVTNQVPLNNESSADYDNPPVQGNGLPTSTQTLENLNNESSADYDNPPVQGNVPPTSTQTLENLNNESSADYDNPPVQGSPTESVPESTEDPDTQPEYFELEPPEESHL